VQTSTTESTEFDVIVLGVGGMGSATCLELARRGVRVLGLERFPLVHDLGSSHGESRIIRKAYFEHPNYVPLLHRAYELWDQLSCEAERQLFVPTGLLMSGPADGETIRGARLSAEQHHLELENLSHAEVEQRFPGFVIPADHDIAYEPGAGTLFVDECVFSQIEQAVVRGAVFKAEEAVLDWSTDGDKVRVRTTTNEYVGRKLIITAGAWASDFLADIGLPLRVVRKFVAWFPCLAGSFRADEGFPAYFFEMPYGSFYGFPSFDGATIKVGDHLGGQLVADPLIVDRKCHDSDVARLKGFLEQQMPNIQTNPVKHSVCLYTMSVDQHFVIDRHPQWPNVVFAAGFSGHGFKFCPVIGQALADLALEGTTSLPIEFLGTERGKPVWSQ